MSKAYLSRTVMRLVLVALPALPASAVETGEMPLKTGYVDPDTGVKIEKIVEAPDAEFQEIYLSVPRTSGTIEQVIVTAPAPKRRPIPQAREFKFLRDYDNDRYGLIIYLDKNQRLPLRLYLDAEQEAP